VVTIDAMGCQKSIAGKIVFKGADCIVADASAHLDPASFR